MKIILKIFFCIALFLIAFSIADEKLDSTTKRSVKQIKSFLDYLGTDKNNTRTYFISKPDDMKTFEDANKACKKLNLKIVSFDTKEEHDLLVNIFNKQINPDYTTNQPAFVGLMRGYNGTWQRMDGSNVEFNMKFFPNEPNNQAETENCLEISQWQWLRRSGINDIPCDLLHNFICVKL